MRNGFEVPFVFADRAHRDGSTSDLVHYHRNRDPARCTRIAAKAGLEVTGPEKLWLCPVNEPSLYPVIAGMPAMRLSRWQSPGQKSHATIILPMI